jgi:hypothetical protein
LGPSTLLTCCYSYSRLISFIDTNGTIGCLSWFKLNPKIATFKDVASLSSWFSLRFYTICFRSRSFCKIWISLSSFEISTLSLNSSRNPIRLVIWARLSLHWASSFLRHSVINYFNACSLCNKVSLIVLYNLERTARFVSAYSRII